MTWCVLAAGLTVKKSTTVLDPSERLAVHGSEGR